MRCYLKNTLFFVFFLSLISSPSLAQESDSSRNTSNNSNPDRRTTHFEWGAIPQAKSYEIEIQPIGRKDGNKDPYRFNVNEPSWDGELKAGKYTMRLRSRDKRDVPGEWSAPEEFYVKLSAPQLVTPLKNAEINSQETDLYELTLQWEEQSDAALYKVHIEDDSKTFLQNLETTENKIKIRVPVARRYRWSLKGFDHLGTEGERLKELTPFTVYAKRLETPQIILPETTFVRQMQWKKVANAEKYSYTLFRREKGERKWKKFTEDNTTATALTFDPQWKGGEYKLAVQAHGELRDSSKIRSLIFNVAKGYRSVAAEQRATIRKSIDRTTDWYVIASYLITQIQYSSINWDELSKPTLSGIGGTGRLGMGYLADENPFGFLGIIDYSGFVIGQTNYRYPSMEAHGIYRWSSGRLGEIRLSGGLYYKELPEIVGQSIADYKVKQIRALGFHGGGEYWYPLTSKLGLQLNGRLYYPFAGSTPRGGKIISSPSMQLGFLGSLRLNGKATGLMGYAMRKDNLKYEVTNAASRAEGHRTNESSVVGHYLNFFLEWDI